MLLIPNAVFDDFTEFLCNKGFSGDVLPEYKKWLRYYLDFCNKYPVPDSKPERVRLFAEKLEEKKQPEKQRECAAHAVSLYFEMQGVTDLHALKYSPAGSKRISRKKRDRSI